MSRSSIWPMLLATMTSCLSGASTQAGPNSVEPSCLVGLYRLPDRTVVDLAPSTPGTLRWRMLDGRTGALTSDKPGHWVSTAGWTTRTDGIEMSTRGCDRHAVIFDHLAAAPVQLQTHETVFTSHGARLAGRLVMPNGNGRVPIVVLIHGAEHDSARAFNYLQRMLPAQGVGAFVYDKRGTGESGGHYTQDFSVLADDAAAALGVARRLAGKRAGRIGFQGGSQGGWVAPIAASRTRVDFVIVSFGLAVSVIDEDQEEVALEMRLHGHDPATIRKALEIARAAERVFASNFTSGLAEFDAVRNRYRGEPWYRDVHGNYTWVILPMTIAEIRAHAAEYRWGTPFSYDPMPLLRRLRVPQLWVLGGQDLDAPSEETSNRLRTLIGSGAPITLAVYPRSEHGMTEFELGPKGERVSTRYPQTYFAMLADYAGHGRLDHRYGEAVIAKPKPGARHFQRRRSIRARVPERQQGI